MILQLLVIRHQLVLTRLLFEFTSMLIPVCSLDIFVFLRISFDVTWLESIFDLHIFVWLATSFSVHLNGVLSGP